MEEAFIGLNLAKNVFQALSLSLTGPWSSAESCPGVAVEVHSGLSTLSGSNVGLRQRLSPGSGDR